MAKARSKVAKRGQPRTKRSTKTTAPATVKQSATSTTGIRIVAIGASAGGLEPIEQFFHETPEKTGFAYVIVQHLSPDFRSMMPELLSRKSNLVIRRVEDGMLIEPDVIFLNPPRSSIEIDGDKFRVFGEGEHREFNLPINGFFESLALHAGERAVCIVMSGTGSDGTNGALAVAEAGGTVLAQDPLTAKFESMPRSVIEKVPQCLFAPPTRLPALLQRVVSGEVIEQAPDTVELDLSSPAKEIIRLLQMRFGLDFGYYKTTTVGRRIRRRSEMAKHKELGDYAVALANDPEELEALYIDLLIGVTAFFRDKAAFDTIAGRCIPELGTRMSKGRDVRLWVAGCASGEEVYSHAILLAERARILKCDLRARIFATDIHPRSLKLASRGVYPPSALSDIPEDIRDRYFERFGDDYQLVKKIRELVVFSKHNLIKDPPFTRMDLVSCRNLLIYLDEQAQRKAIAMFHFALRQGGTLFLGPSESLGDFSDEFDVLDSRWRIFRKRRNVRLLEATRLLPLSSVKQKPEFAAGRDSELGEGGPQHYVTAGGLQRTSLFRIYDAMLAKFVGTSLLLNQKGDVLHVFGDAGRFLTFRSGHFSQKVNDLVDNQLRLTVNAGLDRVTKSIEDEFERIVVYTRANEEKSIGVSVKVSVLSTGAVPEDNPVLLTFTEVKEVQGETTIIDENRVGEQHDFLQKRIHQLERDLRFSEETLQTTVEELETSNEELQATNEELQATNEEMMAANEELQTVNEELHAVNEELYTVSSEHQTKIGELVSLTGDLDNLLESTNIGVLFLDVEKNIRRVTPAVSATFNILDRDIGRPIGHVTSRFEFPDLDEAVSRVIGEGCSVERNINAEGRDFLLRILPYRQQEEIDGAVMTFVDISEIARANRSLAQFADIVSHDLKAPLRAIRNAGEWIVEDLRESADEEIKEHVKMLVEHTERLDGMLSDLREFSNLQATQSKTEMVDVSAELQQIGRLYRKDQLKLVVDSSLPPLETGRAAMRLVLQNIVDNAVKHSDNQPVTVTVKAETASNGVPAFEISDDGPGIDPRHHERIFLPFRKLKQSDAGAGSGIGLALVKKVIDDHGGMIEVISDPKTNRGTTFKFNWPR